jgi:hypothetical protein
MATRTARNLNRDSPRAEAVAGTQNLAVQTHLQDALAVSDVGDEHTSQGPDVDEKGKQHSKAMTEGTQNGPDCGAREGIEDNEILRASVNQAAGKPKNDVSPCFPPGQEEVTANVPVVDTMPHYVERPSMQGKFTACYSPLCLLKCLDNVHSQCLLVPCCIVTNNRDSQIPC